MRKRNALAALCFVLQTIGIAAVSLTGVPAHSQTSFPSKPITIVVGFTPGGSNDMIARALAPKLGQILGTTVIVENRPGAAGTTAIAYTARAKPDGHTVVLSSLSPIAISPNTIASLPYKPSDVITITTVVESTSLLAINPKVEANTVEELIALSKKRQIMLASSGFGSQPHLSIERLKFDTGGDFLHIPYKGAAPAINDVVGGQVDGIFMDYGALIGMVRQGRLRALASSREVGSIKASERVPTAWYAVQTSAETPPDILNTLHAAFVKTVNDPEVRDKLKEQGMYPVTKNSVAEAENFVRAEIARIAKLVQAAGIKPE